jgi:hypothetical protein
MVIYRTQSNDSDRMFYGMTRSCVSHCDIHSTGFQRMFYELKCSCKPCGATNSNVSNLICYTITLSYISHWRYSFEQLIEYLFMALNINLGHFAESDDKLSRDKSFQILTAVL